MLSDLDGSIFITKTVKETIGETDFYYIPWNKDIQQTIIDVTGGINKRKRNILFTHCATSGALSDTGYKLRNAEVSPSVFGEWDYVGLGDYHTPQWVIKNKASYCGSIVKFHWGERDQDKSFTIGAMSTRNRGRIKIKRIPLPDIDFIQIDIDEEGIEKFLKSCYTGTRIIEQSLVQVFLHPKAGSVRPAGVLMEIKKRVLQDKAWRALVSWKDVGTSKLKTENESLEREGISLDIESACIRNLDYNNISDASYLKYIQRGIKDAI
jgi:DNA repair exonuclease SbcCD nuclease subunit